MNQNRVRTAAVAAMLLVLAVLCPGCHEDADPVTGVRVPTPTPPPIADLTGAWSGRFGDSGATDEYFCPGHGGREVTARVTQSGGDVTIVTSSAGYCSLGGATTFTGTLSGSLLVGSLSTQSLGQRGCELAGVVHGDASAQQIELEGGMAGTCNRVHVHVELVRVGP